MRRKKSGSLLRSFPPAPTPAASNARRASGLTWTLVLAIGLALAPALDAGPAALLQRALLMEPALLAQTSGVGVGGAPIHGDPQTPGPVRARTPAPADDSADGRLLAALDLRPGAIVAEIGAGAGRMTLRVAQLVGPTGRVYTTELGDERLRELRRAVEQAAASNVTIVTGDPNQSNLPEQCCDALFMQNVYHHFANPPAMNASLLRSLKPGGTLVITDFAPNHGKTAAPEHRGDNGGMHGVSADTVARELTEAGFELVTPAPDDAAQRTSSRHDFVVVLRKPTASR